ncbi:glycine/sarcosine/betaine reductase complex selenoprotein A [Candidatus Fermentibacteria bacterium]|nr:MAG: glycine/sarcosine/betaine reductase complex selenoprotein A [Candidatus Fermentibacteria bacterium]
MITIQGKKLLLLGSREGVSGSAMEKALAETGADIFYVATECMGCTLAERLDPTSQKRIRDAVEQGVENLLVIIGTADTVITRIYAETVTCGAPDETGPLYGIALGLPVYHMLEEEIKQEIDPVVWEQNVGMMERVLDGPALIAATRAIRQANSRYSL